MGLDIYAGTLTRYYAHNWKSAVQQWAEENGYTFQKITPDGAAVDDEEEEMRPAEVQDIVENWRIRFWRQLQRRDMNLIHRGRKITKSLTTPTSRTGMLLAPCCW